MLSLEVNKTNSLQQKTNSLITVSSMTVQTQMGHHLTEQDVEQNTCQDFLLCKIHLIAEEEIAPALQQTHETEFIKTRPPNFLSGPVFTCESFTEVVPGRYFPLQPALAGHWALPQHPAGEPGCCCRAHLGLLGWGFGAAQIHGQNSCLPTDGAARDSS